MTDLRRKHGRFFTVVDGERFVFLFGVDEQGLYVRRNNTVSVLSLDDVPADLNDVSVFLLWQPTEVTLICARGQFMKKASVPTAPVLPSPDLMHWAREQALIPSDEYDSEEEFRNRVYAVLAGIQDKIDKSGAARSFWDVEYSGAQIVGRKPKRETDVHPVIHCSLFDAMLLSSIEVIPEHHTGIGNLDFMFLGGLAAGRSARLCCEFKLAHSGDYFSGLEKQLPAYMKRCDATYGAYCVLGFSGDWFDEPRDPRARDIELRIRQRASLDPLVHNVRVFTYDLSKPSSASTL